MSKTADKKPVIGIVGLGPVGMTLAVHLQEAGCEVVICDIDRVKINIIRNDGIRLENCMKKHAHFKHICSSVQEMQPYAPDMLIFATKVNFMPVVLRDSEELRNSGIKVLSAQNGIESENHLAEFFGTENTLRMVVNFAGNLNAKNIVKVTFFNPPNYLSSIDGRCDATARQLSERLTSVGLETLPTDEEELQTQAWQKTILNASLSAICAIGRLTMAEAMANPDTNELIRKTIEEAVLVANAEGHTYRDDFVEICMGYLEKAGHHFPSLAVDFINNRPTEIDYFNGKIVDYGRKHGIETPINLSFTNMVKAVTGKHTVELPLQSTEKAVNNQAKGSDCFMGIDLGSAFTKISVLDDASNVLFQTMLPSQSSRQAALQQAIGALKSEFDIKKLCATGYGRKNLPEADFAKTEINCAAKGVGLHHKGAKNIVDIGGEDIKVILCSDNNRVENFFMNDKCAAGTGSFITDIAERAEINIKEMSNLAAQSEYRNELNSFCTVFAKTEIMNWMFDGVGMMDIARGIYLSIANRVSKLRIDPDLPLFMIGGVISHHPFLKNILEDKFGREILVVEKPQYTVSVGAALLAGQAFSEQP